MTPPPSPPPPGSCSSQCIYSCHRAPSRSQVSQSSERRQVGEGEVGSGGVGGQVMSGLRGECWSSSSSSSSCARTARANYIETSGRATYHLTRRGTNVCVCVGVTQRTQAPLLSAGGQHSWLSAALEPAAQNPGQRLLWNMPWWALLIGLKKEKRKRIGRTQNMWTLSCVTLRQEFLVHCYGWKNLHAYGIASLSLLLGRLQEADINSQCWLNLTEKFVLH